MVTLVQGSINIESMSEINFLAVSAILMMISDFTDTDSYNPTRQIVMPLRVNFADIYLPGMRERVCKSKRNLPGKECYNSFRVSGR